MLPRTGFRIARVFGIDIYIHFSWLFIFVLIAVTLSLDFRSLVSKGFPGGVWPYVAGTLTAIVFFASLLAHELSHSYVAKRNGVQISRITLFLFGGVAEMKQDVETPGSEFTMAIAGPMMTFFLAGVFYLFYVLATHLNASPAIYLPLETLWVISLFVGVFNLLPGFPLDGGRVFRAILWKATGDLRKATRIAATTGQVLGLTLSGVGIALVFIDYNRFGIGGLWFVIIGWFLYIMARSSYQQTLLRIAAADTHVRDIMYTGIPTIDSETTLTALRNDYFAAYRLPAFPVAHEGTLVGLVTQEELFKVAPAEWDILNAGRIASPIPDDIYVGADDSLDKVLKQVMRAPGFLLVMQGEQVTGMVTRDAVMQYVNARAKPGGPVARPGG